MFSSSQSVISSLFWLSAKWVAGATTNVLIACSEGLENLAPWLLSTCFFPCFLCF